MEPLSSFAISIAAGIAIELYNTSQSEVKKELNKAFKRAIKKWCPNISIRRKRRRYMESLIRDLLSKPERIADFSSEDSELDSFFKIYEKVLCQYSSAYNYIKDTKDLQRFRRQLTFLSNIKETVEDTNKKFTNYIENNLPNTNKVLELEWVRQIEVYKESVSNLNPTTALDLLDKLEQSFMFNEVKPKNSLLASIEFLKAQCFELIGDADEMYKCYIKALNYDDASIKIKERSCFSYAKVGEFEKSNNLCVKILKQDEFNPTAHFIKIFNSKSKDLDYLLSQTPQIVLKDLNFKRLLYFNTYLNNEYSNQQQIFEKYNLLSDFQFSEQDTVTLDNYKNAIFLIQVTLHNLISTQYFEFSRIESHNSELVKYTYKILGHFLRQIANTEIKDNYKPAEFCYYYTEFLISHKNESVEKMKSLYKQIEIKSVSFLMMLANSLQLIGKIDDAIVIICSQEPKYMESLFLELYCHLKKSDISNYLKTSQEVFNSLDFINAPICESIMEIPNILHLENKLQELDALTILEKKKYENESLKTLIICFIKILCNQYDNSDIATLQSIEQQIQDISKRLFFYIPYCYYLCGEYQYAINSFKNYVSCEIESRDLSYYILALYKSQTDHRKLLQLLKTWRTQFSFNEKLLIIEANLCRLLPDWNRCVSICQYLNSNNCSSEASLTLELVALNEIKEDSNNRRLKEIAESFINFQFQSHTNVQAVCGVLIENGFYKIALEIIYNRAIIPENTEARMDFFTATSLMPEGIMQEKEIVEEDDYVKYSLNGDISFIEVKSENEIAKKLIGHKKGDIVQVERSVIKCTNSITILRITDKYIRLFEEILLEEKNNPFSGLPMQSFEIKEMSFEGINKQFTELFGANGSIQKEQHKKTIEEYYSYQLSFTELMIINFNSDYLGGYFNLINNHDGFTQIPMNYYPEYQSMDNYELVIDFSAVLILYQICREHNIKLCNKFLIISGILRYINNAIRKEKLEPNQRITLDITLEGVIPSIIPEKTKESNIVYLEGLQNWIKSNCIETIVESKLDLIRQLDRKVNNDTLMQLTIENVSLVTEKKERVLITDDMVYNRFFPLNQGKVISTELFLKINNREDNDYKTEFVNNKYIGYTYDYNTILKEFNKKKIGQTNKYSHCINNTTLRLIPTSETIVTVINFLKELALVKTLSDESFKQEATYALTNLLKGVTDEKPFLITEKLIKDKFMLLGEKLDLMIQCYNNARLIMDIESK